MNTIPVTGLITPVYSTDTYPIIDPNFGIDGLRSLTSTTDMYNIPLAKRRGGMVVSVASATAGVTYWTLLPEGSGITWSLGNVYNNEWISLFAGVNVQSVYPIINTVTDISITVPTNYEYLVYGDLTIGSGGTFSNSGKVVIMNGSLVISGGTYSGFDPEIVTIPSISKYSASFSCSSDSTITITHSLSTADITFNVRDGLNYVYPNIELIDNQSISLYTSGTISNGRINIIG
jgi:hypothetical protein